MAVDSLAALSTGAGSDRAGGVAHVCACAEQFCGARLAPGKSFSCRSLGEFQHDVRLRGCFENELATGARSDAALALVPASRHRVAGREWPGVGESLPAPPGKE